MARPTPKPRVLNTEIRTLACELTDAEVADRAHELAQLLGVIDTAEEDKKTSAEYHARELKRLRAEAAATAREVRTHKANREVDCERRADYRSGQAELFRLDTREIVDRRPLTQAELQGNLLELEKRGVATTGEEAK